jgi:hypothetical protein
MDKDHEVMNPKRSYPQHHFLMIDTEQIFEWMDVNYVRPDSTGFPKKLESLVSFWFSFSCGNPYMTFAHAAGVYDHISRN